LLSIIHFDVKNCVKSLGTLNKLLEHLATRGIWTSSYLEDGLILVLVPQTTLVAGENGLGEEASVALVLPGGNLGLSGGGLLGLGGFGGLGSLLGLGGLGRSSGLGLCVGHGLPVDDRGINISHGNIHHDHSED